MSKYNREIEQRDPLQFPHSIYYLCNNANSSSIYSSGMAGDALRQGGSGFRLAENPLNYYLCDNASNSSIYGSTTIFPVA